MITCRRATSAGAGGFRAVRLKSLADSPDAFGSTLEETLKRDDTSWEVQAASTACGNLRNTQFAFYGDDITGLAALYREPEVDSGEVIITWVDPNYRGSDAGPMLVKEMLLWGKKIGISRVGLTVTDSNARAIKFYQNQGFAATGEEDEVGYERNLCRICMVYPLEAETPE